MGLRRVLLALVLAFACAGTASAQYVDPSSSQNVAPSVSPVPNFNNLKVLEGYYAWRRGDPKP